MSVDLFCYVSKDKEFAESVKRRLVKRNFYLFDEKSIVSSVWEADSDRMGIPAEHGFVAKSIFLVSLNDKSAADLVIEVSEVVKKEFGADVLVLHTGETRL